MNISFLKNAFFVFLIIVISYRAGIAQLQTTSEVNLSYPKAKEDKPFYVFLAKTNMGKIEYGQRIVYHFYKQGDLKVTILQNGNYVEPRTLSNNSRTITLKPNASYYFEVTGKGELAYIPDAVKGKEFFEKKNYSSAPLKYEITSADSLVSK